MWPSIAMRWHRSGSTLAQAMACCLTAPSHYLKHYWLIISEVLWHSPEGIFTGNARGNASDMWHSHESNFTGNAPDICVGYEFKNNLFKITSTPPRGQWAEEVAWLAPGRHQVKPSTQSLLMYWQSNHWNTFVLNCKKMSVVKPETFFI